MRLCVVPGCCKPVFGTDRKTWEGYCKSHQYLRTDLDRRPMVVKAMDRASKETRFGRLSTDEPRQPASKIIAGGAALNRWFEDRKKEMTGRCKHCGGKTWTPEDDLRQMEAAADGIYKNNGKFYKHCIAHILPKSIFTSVATHPLNWIELCFWGNSCHSNFDNYTLDITEMNCFDEVIEKFISLYPDIDLKERKRIPAALLNYIQIDT